MTSRGASTHDYPRVIVVILNWNGRDDTLECLGSVKKIEYPNFDVVVVDNGSTDDSIIVIRNTFPDVNVLETGRNLGYAGGNNVGIHHALNDGADYVLLLNNDTIVDKALLQQLIKAGKLLPEGGVFGAKIYFYDKPDMVWYAGGRWLPRKLHFEHVGYDQNDAPEFSRLSETDYVTGCALFARAEAFRRVGLLDDAFFLTFEETDWCYRAAKAGFKCIYVPTAKVWHKVSVSFGGSDVPLVHYFMTRNFLLWARKHLPLWQRYALHRQSWGTMLRGFIPYFSVAAGSASFLKRLAWSFRSWARSIGRNMRSPNNLAVMYGLRDYYFRRFGDCPAVIRTINKL